MVLTEKAPSRGDAKEIKNLTAEASMQKTTHNFDCVMSKLQVNFPVVLSSLPKWSWSQAYMLAEKRGRSLGLRLNNASESGNNQRKVNGMRDSSAALMVENFLRSQAEFYGTLVKLVHDQELKKRELFSGGYECGKSRALRSRSHKLFNIRSLNNESHRFVIMGAGNQHQYTVTVDGDELTCTCNEPQIR